MLSGRAIIPRARGVAASLPSRVRHGRSHVALLDQTLIAAGVFASTVTLARAVEPPEFGAYSLASLAFSVLVMVQNGLLLQPLVVNGSALDETAFRRFLRANLPFQLAFVACSSGLLGILVLWWDPLRPLAVPIVVAAALVQAQELCRRVLYTRARVWAAVANNAINWDLQVPLLALAAVLGVLTLGGALWIIASTSLLAVLFGVWQLRGLASSEGGSVREALRTNLRIGRWSGASAVLAASSTTAYPAIVAVLVDLRATAGIGVIRQVLGPTLLLTRPLDNYHLPRAARALAVDGPHALDRVLWKAALVTVPPLLLYTLLLMALPGVILRLLFGEPYAGYAEALRLFALAAVVYIPVHLLKLEIQARRMQKQMLIMEAWTVVLVYTLGIYLILQTGLVGAALASLAASVSQLVFYAAVLARARRAIAAPPDAHAAPLLPGVHPPPRRAGPPASRT